MFYYLLFLTAFLFVNNHLFTHSYMVLGIPLWENKSDYNKIMK